MTKANRF